ncbi:MAG: hypothetical protein ACI8R8_003460 [Paraglaciecola sp.]|jgi:hypothetical protein
MKHSKLNFFCYGGIFLLSGLFFYINFRQQHLLLDLLPSLSLLQSSWLQSALPDLFINSLPSFIHILFMCLFSAAILGINKKTAKSIPLTWLAIGIALETLQLGTGTVFQRGVFDDGDLVALFTGFLVIVITFNLMAKNDYVSNKFLLLPILGFGIATSLGSLLYEDCHEDFDSEHCVVPVTLTWEELRADIQPEYGNTATLTRPGKIYAKDYLYIVDQYRGIHIFDQTDPQNPIRIAFIPVIGALEISIQGNTLYTNSFIDLVAINLEHIHDGSFTNASYTRTEDIFLLPGTTDFIPDGKRFDGEHYELFSSGYSWHPSYKSEGQLGFIIGYINNAGQKVLFGEFE